MKKEAKKSAFRNKIAILINLIKLWKYYNGNFIVTPLYLKENLDGRS